jgi:mycoredoxin
MYSTTWCSDCRRSRKLLDSLGVAYVDVDIEQDPEAEALVIELNNGMRSVPTIVFPDGSFLTEPSNVALNEKLAALDITSQAAAEPAPAVGLAPEPTLAPSPILAKAPATAASSEPGGAALWIGPIALVIVIAIAIAVFLWMHAGSPLPGQ